MPNEQRNIAIVHGTDRFSPCVEYIFETFSRFCGQRCTVTNTGAPQTAVDFTIYYGVEPAATGGSWLYVPRSEFFGEKFGENASYPNGLQDLVSTAKGAGFSGAVERSTGSARLKFDVIAAAFYLLSGYHDWVMKSRDEHGRVLAGQINLPAETWDLPVVNHWFRQLDELIGSMLAGELETLSKRPMMPGQQTICLTHDVDLLRKYRLSNLPRHLVRASKSGEVGAELKRARAVLSGKLRDPYDSFDHLYTVKERVSAPSTFFFMGSDAGPQNGDYRVGDRDARGLIVRAKAFGDEIGMHGSWSSADDAAVLKAEKMAVERAANGKVQGSRQHYLRFNTPETWKRLTDAGIRYDATGGFPDRGGFKYGWSGCFRPFDLEGMRPLPIIEIPLVCMDVSLAAYEKIPAELALERLTNLMDAACDQVPGGAFVFLWHNTMGDRVAYPGYFDTFEYFFSVASGSARFITLSQLCDEYEAKGL